jgi:hypothetical protein
MPFPVRLAAVTFDLSGLSSAAGGGDGNPLSSVRDDLWRLDIGTIAPGDARTIENFTSVSSRQQIGSGQFATTSLVGLAPLVSINGGSGDFPSYTVIAPQKLRPNDDATGYVPKNITFEANDLIACVGFGLHPAMTAMETSGATQHIIGTVTLTFELLQWDSRAHEGSVVDPIGWNRQQPLETTTTFLNNHYVPPHRQIPSTQFTITTGGFPTSKLVLSMATVADTNTANSSSQLKINGYFVEDFPSWDGSEAVIDAKTWMGNGRGSKITLDISDPTLWAYYDGLGMGLTPEAAVEEIQFVTDLTTMMGTLLGGLNFVNYQNSPLWNTTRTVVGTMGVAGSYIEQYVSYYTPYQLSLTHVAGVSVGTRQDQGWAIRLDHQYAEST